MLRLKGRNVEENPHVKMGAYHTIDLELNRCILNNIFCSNAAYFSLVVVGSSRCTSGCGTASTWTG